MKIVIIDGQGGKMGKSVIEQLKKRFPELETYAIGTNRQGQPMGQPARILSLSMPRTRISS